MRLGHSSTHVEVAMSYFLAGVLDLGTRMLRVQVACRGPWVARCELLLAGSGADKTDRNFLAHPMSIVHDRSWPTVQI